MNNCYIGNDFYCQTFIGANKVYAYVSIIQELLGHNDCKIIERYTHLSNQTIQRFQSTLD